MNYLRFSQKRFISSTEIFTSLGLDVSKPLHGCFNGKWFASGKTLPVLDPSTNQPIAHVQHGTVDDYRKVVEHVRSSIPQFRSLPIPARGNIVMDMRQAFAEKRTALGHLISLEMGKIVQEGVGEVQEVIDVCEYAVGLSRSLSGKVLPSERPKHFMMEQWNPIGMVGVISAFNFPVAVYGWNAAISLVCGNPVVWKPAPSTPLSAIVTSKIMNEVLESHDLPGVCGLVCGGADVGQLMSQDKHVDLVSFTGSTAIGRQVGVEVQKRFGRHILELGGNNATIVLKDADQDLALRSILFAAVGTAGQRCTTTRRLILEESIYDQFVARMVEAYKSLRIGNPLEPNTLIGPLHSKAAVQQYQSTIKKAMELGGKVVYGNRCLDLPGNFVLPTIITNMDPKADVVQHETFAPILYVLKAKNVEDAIHINNSVGQGLSSSLFTSSQANLFHWTGPNGSDCGIVNVNIPTNGAEVGGAFGGEKETGGGRESGSDAWKQYMRRQTCTINYGGELPLAQGIKFE